jgi:hypothetical protein
MSDDRLRELENVVAAQVTQINMLQSQLSEQKLKAEMLEAQKALAHRDLEIHLLKEGGDNLKIKALELETRDATIEALKAKNRLLQMELKERKQKGAANHSDDEDSAVDIGKRQHANLKNRNGLCLVMWRGQRPMHAAHFNQLGSFVKACSLLAVDEDDEDDEPESKKRKKPETRNWLGLLELEKPFSFEEVERSLKLLGQNDALIGPVFLQREKEVLTRGKTGSIGSVMPVKLSFLRGIETHDNFMRQSKQIISDFVLARKDRNFSRDDSWLYLHKVME